MFIPNARLFHDRTANKSAGTGNQYFFLFMLHIGICSKIRILIDFTEEFFFYEKQCVDLTPSSFNEIQTQLFVANRATMSIINKVNCKEKCSDTENTLERK